MKKLLLILSLICFISCAVNDCVVITRKENIGDNFLFFLKMATVELQLIKQY